MAGDALRNILLVMAALAAGAVWASVPPPPVNQYLGIPDTRFAEMTFVTCLGCHGAPESTSAPLKSGYLPDRHHLRIDTPIGAYSASPFPEKSPDGEHKCVTCHAIDWVEDPSRPSGGFFRFAQDPSDPVFRDCLNCHTQKKNRQGELIATVHHLTERAQQANCHICHGSLIDDPNGDHRIPDPANHPDDPENHYDISLTTPWPGIGFYNSRVQLRGALKAAFAYKLELPPNPTEEDLRRKEEAEAQIDYIMENFDPPTGETGRPMGNCTYCHFAGIDDVTGQRININYATHHGTGVGQPGSGSVHGCTLCHQPSAPPDFTIRGCERCHGINSLHSIEYDAIGDGVVAGEELPFFGHIGNRKNCDGCHKNSRDEMVSANIDSRFDNITLIPEISEISRTVVTAGLASTLQIIGSGFVNTLSSSHTSGNQERTWLRLTRNDGTTIDIHPDSVSSTHMEVTIPANLSAGNYNLTITKGDPSGKELNSTSIHFLIKPEVAIDDIRCEGEHLTLWGSGFGSYLDAEDSGTLLSSNGERCSIESWSDRKIVASCAGGIENPVRLNSIFGTATTNVTCRRAEGPRWWSIWSWWSSWSWARR